jgi:hypothetical protein
MNNPANPINAPEWFSQDRIVKSLDARTLLARGEHPLEQVQSETALLSRGQIYKLITPFTPFPLIEKIRNEGYDFYIESVGPNETHTFFCKN